MPVLAFEEPFTKIMVDCVGPLPRTKSGCQFLLTVTDVPAGFPEPVPLDQITAESVVVRNQPKEYQGSIVALLDCKAQVRESKPGGKVLAFLPLVQNPLTVRFQGPCMVEKGLDAVECVVDTPD